MIYYNILQLERPDYWEEVKSKFNLEEKAKS